MTKKEISIAESLSRAHEALQRDLQALEECIAPDSGKSVASIRARLKTTQRHILEHFRFEEQNGYMEKVRRREPRLEHAIDQLVLEHRQLAGSLETLLEAARDASSSDAFPVNIRQWIAAVRQHENCEDRLVQDAFNYDIGAED
jgi:hypothetical protein